MNKTVNFSNKNVTEYEKFIDTVNLKDGNHYFYVNENINNIELYLKLNYDRVTNQLLIYYYKFITCPHKFRQQYKKIAFAMPPTFKKDEVEYVLRTKGFKQVYYIDELT